MEVASNSPEEERAQEFPLPDTNTTNLTEEERTHGLKQTGENIRTLYEIFGAVKWNRNVEKCNDVLKTIGFTIVKHKFENFIDEFISENDIHKMSEEDREKLYAEIDKISLVADADETFSCIRETFDREQFVLYAATRCCTIKSTILNDISLLNVPALMDIMWNCTLFRSEHENIEPIVHAYTRNFVSESGLDNLLDDLKSAMQIFLDTIDCQLLPQKHIASVQLRRVGSDYEPELVPRWLFEEPDNCIARLEDDLRNPSYINWVKGTLTLKYVNEAARDFIQIIFLKFQIECLPDRGKHFEDGKHIQQMCRELCESKKRKKTNIHCLECKTLFEKVEQLHRWFDYSVFKNCKNEIVAGTWGFAKLFMPKKCGNINTSNDADTYILFHIILNYIDSGCEVAYIHKIIDLRNKLMHSPKLTMTDDHLNELCDSEFMFLEAAMTTICKYDIEVVEKLLSAKENIEKIRVSVIEIGNILELAKTAVEYDYQELLRQKIRGANVDITVFQERDKQLQARLGSYQNIEKELYAQKQNEELNKKLLDQEETTEALSSQLHAQEQTNEELGEKLHAREQANEELIEKLHTHEQTNEELGEKLHAREQTNEALITILSVYRLILWLSRKELHDEEQTEEQKIRKLHSILCQGQ